MIKLIRSAIEQGVTGNFSEKFGNVHFENY
jgi:hypothetical protein